jgi:hypothetical protein
MFQKKWDIVFGGNFQDNLEEEGVSITKKKGRTFEMTVNEGAKAQIHCPHDALPSN